MEGAGGGVRGRSACWAGRDLFEEWAKDGRLVALPARNECERKGDLRPEEEIRAAFEVQLRMLRGFSAAGGDADILHP